MIDVASQDPRVAVVLFPYINHDVKVQYYLGMFMIAKSQLTRRPPPFKILDFDSSTVPP